MLKYEFSIQTRDGQKVNGIIIAGTDQAHAERKLRQMYRQSEVLRCEVRAAGDRSRHPKSTEDMMP
jgi:hypothetical protein